ncbi:MULTISPECIES: LysR family transcriptional regulator [Alphaproteobacteria]|uniref:LysR family transcriptional regulator n=2 Tax=Alphaproteobacteria TaxID=28211 RepID=A0A512HFN2_9HYPH|nr:MULTISPECIES: LysR family transcriptional regulator [Alphaproteobacteria]GEO84266.1 LysR family transcriptional regulator [Ciceribacter naphthalenivorans]GLR24802.1 LysR family transcriptional regulator [Ciceribacter naphthalenivorans]GLT07658.1 LysR family transcriptional regulator [Sphingomonas psychrolutea]
MQDWDDLRFFVALADEGSLSAAARRLKVDHATVARRIAALEARVNARLVDRRPRRYLLTAEGARIADHARRMEAEVFALERGVMPADAAQTVEISVSAPPVIASTLVAPRLATLKTQEPHIRLRLLAETRNASLARREADVALRLSRPGDSTLVIRKAGTMRYRLYATRPYLESHAPEAYGFIAFDEALGDTPQQVWMKEIAGARETVLLTNDLGVQCAAAAAGLGIAVLPDFLGDLHGLCVVGDAADHIDRDAFVTYHADLRNNRAATTVAGFLATCLPRLR